MPDRRLIVVGGANGVGKTTFAVEYASRLGVRYLGADAIAAQLSADNPALVRISAGREFVAQVKAAITSGTAVVVESTLAGRTFARTMRKARDAGFEITIVYLFVDSPGLCIDRVLERVQKGGHDVPERDIRRRFTRSLGNFWHVYRELAQHWVLIYNSGDRPMDVAIGSASDTSIRDADLHDLFQRLLTTHA